MSSNPEQQVIGNSEVVDILRQFGRLSVYFDDPMPVNRSPLDIQYEKEQHGIDISAIGAFFAMAGVRYYLYEIDIQRESAEYPSYVQYATEWRDREDIIEVGDVETVIDHVCRVEIWPGGVTAKHYQVNKRKTAEDEDFQPVYSDAERRLINVRELFAAHRISGKEFRAETEKIEAEIRQAQAAIDQPWDVFTFEHFNFLMPRLSFLDASYLDS
ncbi:MAG TPA: hypothetical protein VIJ68_02795 [Candidatus Saccharimonadales bacterium]